MYNLTISEIKKAFRALPPYQPMTHNDLFWYVKDFYHGKGFIEMASIHSALAQSAQMFEQAKINGEKMFWISEKNT